MDRVEREKKIVELLRLIQDKKKREWEPILAQASDDPELIAAALEERGPRSSRIFALSERLFNQPEDQWERILAEHCDDPELIADVLAAKGNSLNREYTEEDARIVEGLFRDMEAGLLNDE